VIIDFVKEKGQDLPIYELVEQFNNFLKQSKTQWSPIYQFDCNYQPKYMNSIDDIL